MKIDFISVCIRSLLKYLKFHAQKAQLNPLDALSPYSLVRYWGAPALFVRRGAPGGEVSKENLLSVAGKVAVATMYSILGACSIMWSFEDVCV